MLSAISQTLKRLAFPLGLALLLAATPGCKPAVQAEAKPLELEERDDGFTYVKGTSSRYTGTFQILSKSGHAHSHQDYQNGLMHGPFVLLHSDGKPKRQVDYHHGSIVRERKWYDNGQLKADEQMREGLPYGLSQFWFPDGRLQKLVTLGDNFVLHGHVLEFDESGNLVTDAIINHGKVIGGFLKPESEKPTETSRDEVAINTQQADTGTPTR
jgi:antitoxin component YwqK of YwqJK toxin-antitoxin module